MKARTGPLRSWPGERPTSAPRRIPEPRRDLETATRPATQCAADGRANGDETFTATCRLLPATLNAVLAAHAFPVRERKMAGEVHDGEAPRMEAVSPRTRFASRRGGEATPGAEDDKNMQPRADPDAQTTVTDLVDFTEYLPSDVVRSLTLIGKLDQAYTDASLQVDDLTTTWGQLPSLAPGARPSPAKLRAEISEQLNRAVSSRVFAHAEAVRMSESLNRHYQKAVLLLSKLQAMIDNYPAEDQQRPASRSPQMLRAKLASRTGGDGAQKVRRQRIPRVTVPGEVLAPYDIIYDSVSDDSGSSSDEESDVPPMNRRTPGATPRIKLVSHKSHKPASRYRQPALSSDALSAAAAANAAALLNPPPENAVIGSADAPWLRLTDYELARLRKRMKKNATWTPSETMVARELKALNRGPEAYREAKKTAEDEGRVFEPAIPAPTIDSESGTALMPAGAIGADSLDADEVPTSNRGMKLNEAKKLKRESLAKQAAEDAEEGARKMAAAAKLFLGSNTSPGVSESSKDAAARSGKTRSNTKRKRDGDGEGSSEANGAETPSSSWPQAKRTKTETPVPPPHHPGIGHHSPSTSDTSKAPQLLTPGGTVITSQSATPVPLPLPRHGSSVAAGTRSAKSPTPSPSSVVTTSVPTKAPAETPVPLPRTERRNSTTPGGESTKRETRGEAAKRTQHDQLAPDSASRRPSSRGATPGTTPGPDGHAGRRPSSRGKATSQEPQSLASERPRRASTARNTPAPEGAKQPGKRTKRPAPGVVSITNSGGNSAVGKRKAAPKKKARTTRKDKDQTVETEMEEVDDEGNAIDPDEPRYCLCNRVSFGTMIQCDNMDVSDCLIPTRAAGDQLTRRQNCKQEWFHLECVGMSDIPARTTKWYCPDCRKLLKIGEKGEVNARGVKK